MAPIPVCRTMEANSCPEILSHSYSVEGCVDKDAHPVSGGKKYIVLAIYKITMLLDDTVVLYNIMTQMKISYCYLFYINQ